jgi:hypothetical protein
MRKTKRIQQLERHLAAVEAALLIATTALDRMGEDNAERR